MDGILPQVLAKRAQSHGSAPLFGIVDMAGGAIFIISFFIFRLFNKQTKNAIKNRVVGKRNRGPFSQKGESGGVPAASQGVIAA